MMVLEGHAFMVEILFVLVKSSGFLNAKPVNLVGNSKHKAGEIIGNTYE